MAGNVPQPTQQNNFKVQFDENGDVIFTAPSWTNFHFDRERIMREIMG
jgi:hypothetical protein